MVKGLGFNTAKPLSEKLSENRDGYSGFYRFLQVNSHKY